MLLTSVESCGKITMMEEELLTREEAAKLLRMSTITLYRLTRDGELTVIKRGRGYTRYRKSDLLAFLDRYTIKGEGKQ